MQYLVRGVKVRLSTIARICGAIININAANIILPLYWKFSFPLLVFYYNARNIWYSATGFVNIGCSLFEFDELLIIWLLQNFASISEMETLLDLWREWRFLFHSIFCSWDTTALDGKIYVHLTRIIILHFPPVLSSGPFWLHILEPLSSNLLMRESILNRDSDMNKLTNSSYQPRK